MILEFDLPVEHEHDALKIEQAFRNAKFVVLLDEFGNTKTIVLDDESWRIKL